MSEARTDDKLSNLYCALEKVGDDVARFVSTARQSAETASDDVTRFVQTARQSLETASKSIEETARASLKHLSSDSHADALTPEAKELLRLFFDDAPRIHLKPGEPLISQGSSPDALYLVVSGKMNAQRREAGKGRTAKGRDVVIETYQAGEIVGLISFFLRAMPPNMAVVAHGAKRRRNSTVRTSALKAVDGGQLEETVHISCMRAALDLHPCIPSVEGGRPVPSAGRGQARHEPHLVGHRKQR